MIGVTGFFFWPDKKESFSESSCGKNENDERELVWKRMDERMPYGAKTNRWLHTRFGSLGFMFFAFFLLHFETATALV